MIDRECACAAWLWKSTFRWSGGLAVSRQRQPPSMASSDTDTTVFVNEAPAAGHDLIWSYSGNGNALRVGNELIRYSRISRTAPCAFLDCERGAFKTQAAAHEREAAVDYLQQRYLAFYPEPDSPLADERGEMIRRFRPQAKTLPLLAEGSNSLRFDCEAPSNASARAEVTLVSLGSPFGSRRDESEIGWNRLDREYDIPRVVTRTDGIDNDWKIVRHADGPKGRQDRARVLEIEIRVEQLGKPEKEGEEAHLDTPTLTIGDALVRFPVRLLAGQRLVCRDQTSWRVLGANGDDVASGKVSGSFPTLAQGANRVTLAFEKESCSDLRVLVKTAKVYREL